MYGREPSTWRDFVYGMSHIDRANAREALRIAGAVSSAQTPDEKGRERWFAQMEAIGGGRG